MFKKEGLKGFLDTLEKEVKVRNNADKVVEKLAKRAKKEIDDAHSGNLGEVIVYNGSEYYPLPIQSDAVTHIEVNGNHARVTTSGENFLFFEFGAGVNYNSPRDWINELNIPIPSNIAPIGTFGKGKGKRNEWYYMENHLAVKTKGIKSVNGFAHAINQTVGSVEVVLEEVMNE